MISRHESFLWSSGRAGTVDGGPWVAELLGYIALRVAIARGAGDLVPLQGRSPDDRAAAAALCNSRSHSVAVSPQMMLTSSAMCNLDLDQFHPDKIQLSRPTLTNNHSSGVILPSVHITLGLD